MVIASNQDLPINAQRKGLTHVVHSKKQHHAQQPFVVLRAATIDEYAAFVAEMVGCELEEALEAARDSAGRGWDRFFLVSTD